MQKTLTSYFSDHVGNNLEHTSTTSSSGNESTSATSSDDRRSLSATPSPPLPIQIHHAVPADAFHRPLSLSREEKKRLVALGPYQPRLNYYPIHEHGGQKRLGMVIVEQTDAQSLVSTIEEVLTKA